MSKKVNLNFYTFTFEKVSNPDSTVQNTEELNQTDVTNHLTSIMNSCSELENNRRTKKLLSGNYVDVISFENNKLFGRIGNPNPKNTLAIRNDVTLHSDPINIGEHQIIETYTFFFMDVSTKVLVYLSLGNAPVVSGLKEFFNRNQIFFSYSVILEERQLEKLMKKDSICSVKVQAAIPNADVFEQIFGGTPEGIDSFANISHKDISINLSTLGKKKLFEDSRKINGLIRLLNRRFGEVKKLQISAKDDGERSETYDLISSKMTKTVDLGVDNIRDKNENDFYNLLFDKYAETLPDIRRLVDIPE